MPTDTNTLGFPLLTVILAVPALGGLLCMWLDEIVQIRWVAGATAVLDFLLAIGLLAKFQLTPRGGAPQWVFQFSDKHDWVAGLGITYWVGVDGIAVFLVGLTTLMMAIAILAATYMIEDRVKLFMVFMLFLETGLLGVFMSENLFLFFVFWEAMLIPTYFLIGMWGEERRVYATMKFLIYTILGSFLMLVGIFYLWSQSQAWTPGHIGTLDMIGTNGLIAHPVSATAQTWLFLAFGLAFAIKLPIWPFHTWAPTVYTESPVPVVIAVAGIMSKAGAFGFLRYALPLFPHAARDLQSFVSILAIIGMLYAALLALVQTDIKRLVAFSSVSHMNLIALGIFALNPTGFNGSVLQLINHSVIISGLFLAVAYITARTGTRLLTHMGGLGERWPLFMWVFFVFVLAGLDLPGLSSFAGEFLILAGVFRENAFFSTIAAFTVVLAAWYMIRFFQNSMNGPVTASPQQVAVVAEDPLRSPYEYPVMRRLISGDLLPRELLLLVPLVALILYIGVQPDSLTARINSTTAPLASVVHGLVQSTPIGGGR